jgi:hypothetical protein
MNKKSKHFLKLALFFTVTNCVFGQVPIVETPRPASLFTTPGTNYGHPNPTTRQINHNPTVQNRNNQTDTYEQDKRELQQRNAELYKILYGHEYSMPSRSIRYELPSRFGSYGTEYYHNALEKLSKMLRGEIPVNLKDAVFTVENAYFENRLNYNGYSKAINDLVQIAYMKTTQDGYDWKNPTTRNVMLFRTMADTLEIKIPNWESTVVSYPMQYDFEDFYGRNDYSKMFVSKLLATNTGQCHSLPLLYLIMCEETETEANLALSPSHSYIKFKDKDNVWHNLELTNGTVVTDAFIVGSGYITAEAIRNRLYLEPLTKRQVIAQGIADLASGYIHKYGYDSFVKQCVDSILKYDDNNLRGWMIKSNYETVLFDYAVNQVGRPHPDILKVHYPQIYELLENRNATYGWLDASGYREMPPEAYEAWLRSVNEEKERQEHKEKYNKILQIIR